MGYENIDDALNDTDYQNALFSLGILEKVAVRTGEFEYARILKGSWLRICKDYIDFRLEKFDSEGREVIREAYKILGYNPYKRLK